MAIKKVVSTAEYDVLHEEARILATKLEACAAKLAAAEKYEKWAHDAMAELKAERDEAEKRAARLEGLLQEVEILMSAEEHGEIYHLWEDGVIGAFDDAQDWTWETTLDAVRDLSIPTNDLGGEVREYQLPQLVLYRKIREALSQAPPPPAAEREEGLGENLS